MSFYTQIKLRPADKKFSEFIRKRDGECVFRIKCFGKQTFKELSACHFHSRRKESVRFDPQNVDSGCSACHMFLHTAEGQKWHHEFKQRKLGDRAFDLLQLRAETPTKRDDRLVLLYVNQLLKEV